MLDQMNLRNIYGTSHPKATECTFVSCTHRTFSKHELLEPVFGDLIGKLRIYLKDNQEESKMIQVNRTVIHFLEEKSRW